MSASEVGSGVGVTEGVRAPEVIFQTPPVPIREPLRPGRRGPPSYPTKDPDVDVVMRRRRLSPGVAESRLIIVLPGGTTVANIPEFIVKGPMLGDSPLIVTSSEMTAPVVLLITMSPPSVQPEPEHALPVPTTGDRLPDTISVTVSARALGAAKHKAKTRQSTAPIVLNRLGI